MAERHGIVIVGGGLGGLTLARVLQVNGIESVVLELEPSRETRVQGGMLDIHHDTGQKALRAAALFEGFRARTHAGGEAMRVLDRHGIVQIENHDEGQFERPEIDRGELRDLLLDGLDAGRVRWGQKVTAVEPLEAGGWSVTLADDTVLEADVVVGADGAWSRVRTLVTDALPEYSGISFVEADFHVAADHPVESEIMGPGMLFALGGEVGIMGHAETDGSLHVYWGYRCSEQWVDSIDFSTPEIAKQELVALMDGWDTALCGLIANADGDLVPRRIHALPVGIRWQHRPGVTLLGDAAHLMSPFAGEGANLALYDASQLALAIVADRENLDDALQNYETEMFDRAEASARQSADSLEVIYADDAPQSLVELFASFGPPAD